MSAACANQLFVDELYDEALAEYARALDVEQSIAAFCGRAACNLRLDKHTAALQDSNSALSIDPNCEIACYRKARACFALEEYETAAAAFARGLALLEAAGKSSAVENRKYPMWLRKCEAEIEDEDDVEEEEAEEADAPPPPPTAAMALDEPTGGPRPVPCTIKYQYYQTATHLTITLLAKGLTEEMCSVVFKEKSLVVRVVRENCEMTVIHGELYDPIVVEGCGVKYFPSKVEIKLQKKEGFNWNELLSGNLAAEEEETPRPKQAQAPTATSTPYASKRDWNQLEKEMSDELEKEKPEGEEALNKLFQDIYGKATPETRRAMNKSFQTSGGTVLSTNWSEVGTTDYEEERQAPSGMEWKTWEGKKLPQKDDD